MTQPTLTTRNLAEDLEHVMFSATIEGGDEDLSASILIDFSALTGSAERLSIQSIDWSANACSVNVLFDADTDDLGIVLSRQGRYDISSIQGIIDPQSTGSTGDILVSTLGYAANSTASLIIRCKKLRY